MGSMQRGEIWLADLDPGRGSEAEKIRPVVLVSNDGAHAAARRTGRGVVTVVPVTSNVSRVYPFQVYLPPKGTGLRTRSKAQAEQVRSIDVSRLVRRVGSLPAPVLAQVDAALRVHLSL